MMKTKAWIFALVVFMALGVSGFLSAAPGGAPKGVSGKPSTKPPITRSRSATTRISTTKKPQKPDARRQNSISEYINQRNNPAASVTPLSTRKSAPSQAARQGRSKRFSNNAPQTASPDSLHPASSLINRRTAGSMGVNNYKEPLEASRALIEHLARNNIVDKAVGQGTSVIGRNPEYIKIAEASGSSFFQIKPALWNRLTVADRNYANMRFIDVCAAKRYVFRVTTTNQKTSPRAEIERNPNGQLYKEVNRLITDHKYTWSNNGTQLDPPPGKNR